MESQKSAEFDMTKSSIVKQLTISQRSGAKNMNKRSNINLNHIDNFLLQKKLKEEQIRSLIRKNEKKNSDRKKID